jgi:hypothetical protein
MVSWKLPFDLGDILLTPQVVGLNPALQAALLTILCLLPLALVIWLYRYEMQLVARTTALGLLFLRVAVLALLLILVCLQPIYGRTRTDNLPGYVLVAVDRSASMDVADGPNGATRIQTAQRMLSREGVGLLPALTAKHDVELLGFHQETWELKPDQLDELFRPLAEPSAAAFTDLRLPLTRALERSAPGQAKALGIVLLTDGQHNSGDSPTAKARELGERRVPIYPIALGSRRPPPDAVMVSVQAPSGVFKDVEVKVEATFRITGLPAQDFRVELHRNGKDGKKSLAERIIRHQGKDRTYTESFPVRMEEAGTQTLTATVRPVKPDTQETCNDNNSRSTTLNVSDDKANVLLIDGEARWEYHYLATALKRDRALKVESVVFHQPRLNEEVEGGGWRVEGKNNSAPSTLPSPPSTPRQQLPAGADGLADFDCIILGDVGVEKLPLADRQRLEQYVGERGGTLVIVAGKRFMPLAYPEIEANGQTDPLRKLLPIESPRVLAPVEGFALTLTQAGEETKFLELDADPGKNAAVWRGLPRHFWGIVGQAKPGATTLAHVADPQTMKSALIVKQNYGLGRVLFVGLDSTWRWRYRKGDAYHHAFWGAAIRWAASDKPLMTGNDFIRFGTPQPIYGRDEEVKIVVRLSEDLGPIKPDLLAAARVLQTGKSGGTDKAVALVPLNRRAAQPRVLEGQVRSLPPGEYAVELVMPDYADKLSAKAGPPDKSMRAHFTIRPPESQEMIDLETRWPLLEELAAESGGKVFTPENAGELIDLLVQQSVTYSEHYEQKLWQWWVVLVLVLAFLTIEWTSRKWAGLP